MSPDELTTQLKQESGRLGFDLVGACPAAEPSSLDHFDEWLESDCAGEMSYLAERRSAYQHPRGVLEGTQSLLMLATVYRSAEPVEPGPGQGQISRYAWGLDYHHVIYKRLLRLVKFHRELTPDAAVRGVVDTAPLLEREFAQKAGLGWIGRNATLINRERGSWTFLAALLTTEILDYDEPTTESHCGSCNACIKACPTGALSEPYRVDARRCVSYLTNVLRGPIDEELRPLIDNRFWGCDACQQACPWNKKTQPTDETAFWPREGNNPVDLIELFSLDEESLRNRFQKTPLKRAKRSELLRNAAIVLGNGPSTPEGKAALELGASDPDPVVSEACSWALKQF